MKALRLHGVEDARIDDVPEPAILPGSLKIEVAWAGICGSDLGLYQYMPIPNDYVTPIFGEAGPHTLGHEFSGHIVEIGEGVSGFAVGDLVAVQPNLADGTCPACLRGEPNLCANGVFIGIQGGGGGFSQYVVAPASHTFVLPPNFTPQVGAMVESISVAWHAVARSGAASGSTALIIGAGPIGLGLLLCLKAVGAERIVVSELSPARAQLARDLGADVVDPRAVDVDEYVRQLTEGAGVDVSFDASGVGTVTFGAALGALRSGGTSVVVAQFHGEVSLDPNLFLLTEKHVTGSFAYTREDFLAVIAAIADGRIDPSPLISSTIGLDDIVTQGIQHLLGSGRATEVKILVSPTPV